MKTPILGSCYVARSVSASDNRMVNLFPEFIIEGGNEAAFLQKVPGRRLIATVGTGPIRGLWQFGGQSYIVSGDKLYRMTTDWAVTEIDFVSGVSGPVSMADNGTQLFVACNGPSYIYNASTNGFSPISDVDFPGAKTVDFLDGYFIFNEPNSQRVWSTSLLDGTSIDPLDFASVEGSPDFMSAVVVDHLEAWFFGLKSTQVYYDASNSNFPLSPIQGAFLEIGCIAPFSVAKLDNSIFWLGADNRGQGIIYRTSGYQAQRVSTHAVEWQIQSYEDLTDAIAYTYQQDGHSFYVITFPLANKTWVCDVASDHAWHERAAFENGEFVRIRDNCQMAFGGEIIVGDHENGNLYALDLDTYDDNGSPIRWLRSWRALPQGKNDFKRSTHHNLQVNFESGVGLNSGQGSDPQAILRWSDDGYNWSNEHWRSIGKIGEKGRRVIWRRLGMTEKLRDRRYEISGTDAVKIIITGAELQIGSTDA